MFLNATMLAGLGGMAVPLVLHMLARARYRNVDWGAMMFLRGSDLRQRQSARLKQWILLLLRMAMVGLLAVALGRPLVQARAVGQEASTAAVIVLDRSLSMSMDEAGRSRFEKATEAARQVLRFALRKGDQACLLPVGGADDLAGRSLTSNLAAVERELEGLKVAPGSADLPAALHTAMGILAQSNGGGREIYVICDTQASSWRSASDGFLAAWAREAGDLRPPAHLTIIPVGEADTENVAVESIELVSPPAIRAIPAQVDVQLRNYGTTAQNAVPVSLSVQFGNAGVKPSDATVNLPAGGSATVRASVTFNEAGSHVLSAEIQGPGLAADKRLSTAVDVIEPMRALIVSGDERAEPFRSESDFIRLALAPFKTSKLGRGVDPAREVVVVPFEQWPAAPSDLRGFDLVVLANVPWFSDAQVRALERFVYEGGGLLIAPGNLANIDHYNTALYRSGTGLIPARLKAPVAADGSQATKIIGLETAHPIFRFLKGQAERLPGATVARYFPDEALQSGARRLGTYASGSSFLIELGLERGRVLLCTTPLDADWNTLPLSNFYLPFVQSAAQYLAGGALRSRDLAPGEPLTLATDRPIDPATIQIRLPSGVLATASSPGDGRSVPLRISTGGETSAELSTTAEGCALRFLDTQRLGIYVLTYRFRGEANAHAVHYVVQAPRDESDLTPLSAEQWKRLERSLGFVKLDPAATPLAAAISRGRTGRELWLPLVGAIMLLGIVELWAARLFTRRAP